MESTAAIQTKPKRYRAPKPRTPALRRGKACLNCRHLKIRCDGVQPICGNCVRLPKDDQCTYNFTASRRKRNQEHKQADSACCSTGFDFPLPDEFSDFASTSNLSTPALSPGALSSDSLSEVAYGDFELPTETVNQLVRSFIDNAQPFGFFLDMNCLRTVATPSVELLLLQAPPANSLLFAAALLGARLANHTHYEKILVRRASESILAEVCSWESSQCNTSMAAETIQAQLLLARYFLLDGQTLAAKVQVSGAEAIALGLELNEDHLRSAAWWAIVELQTMLDVPSPSLPAATSSFVGPVPMMADREPFFAGFYKSGENIPPISELDWEWAEHALGHLSDPNHFPILSNNNL
ncbi:Zn(2)-C6 fungal-type domain-containing protein [Mycena indigotica]|uniref:Zn(2)-C6 fungal-type domain-containing protein n=1 Tax=Mycena indigotica TaxID=2126181 RepID=A0A8H6S540_9AGAR|nr:Zn(2)-C6 fungal-type domain-containing protein [Mycena indigotica]KAF7293059.1 Zn(2)-C6 fungal-type domain-containing protein [Mycena indigotica]